MNKHVRLLQLSIVVQMASCVLAWSQPCDKRILQEPNKHAKIVNISEVESHLDKTVKVRRKTENFRVTILLFVDCDGSVTVSSDSITPYQGESSRILLEFVGAFKAIAKLSPAYHDGFARKSNLTLIFERRDGHWKKVWPKMEWTTDNAVKAKKIRMMLSSRRVDSAFFWKQMHVVSVLQGNHEDYDQLFWKDLIHIVSERDYLPRLVFCYDSLFSEHDIEVISMFYKLSFWTQWRMVAAGVSEYEMDEEWLTKNFTIAQLNEYNAYFETTTGIIHYKNWDFLKREFEKINRLVREDVLVCFREQRQLHKTAR